MARDFEDIERELGGDAVRAAVKAARHPWDDGAPPVWDEQGEPVARLTAKPFVFRPEEQIPPRRWLYGRHLLRKFLSVDIAAGGIGKSSVKVVEALALATGRPLLNKPVHDGPKRVWLYNLEDPAEETERRIAAACKWFNIRPDDIEDRLFVSSGREQPLCIAEDLGSGARIVRPISDALVAALQANRIDVFSLDPFVSAHTISENDNGAIDLVAKEFARIADVCDCSINLVHHVRKSNGQEATADSSRGASSLIGAARSVIVYNRMSKEEGEAAGIPAEQIGFHFRAANDKANLSPPEAAEWHRMNNVDLANGDSVGVACPWAWPDPFDGLTGAHLYRVQKAVSEGRWRENVQAKDWVGIPIASALMLDHGDDRDQWRIKAMLKQWLKAGALVRVEGKDEKRNVRTFIEVGQWQNAPASP